MCILDLSKVLMYDFHYNFIKKKYGGDSHSAQGNSAQGTGQLAKLLFTDTDSLCYHIRTEDAYGDFYRDKGLFDNSDYEKSSNVWLHSSVGSALHRYRGGHGFESR